MLVRRSWSSCSGHVTFMSLFLNFYHTEPQIERKCTWWSDNDSVLMELEFNKHTHHWTKVSHSWCKLNRYLQQTCNWKKKTSKENRKFNYYIVLKYLIVGSTLRLWTVSSNCTLIFTILSDDLMREYLLSSPGWLVENYLVVCVCRILWFIRIEPINFNFFALFLGFSSILSVYFLRFHRNDGSNHLWFFH